MGFVLITSDFHFGSSFACFPEDFRTHNDTIIPLNRGQRYLNECFDDAVSRVPDEFDIFVMNGDGIEGPNKCNMARNLTEVDPLWQVRAATEKLKPVTDRARNALFTKGSYYHVGSGGGGDEGLAQACGAKPNRKGEFAPAWRRFMYKGVYFDVAHRQSTTIRYHSMPMERELDFLYLRFAKKRLPPPEHVVLIRSHAHWGYGLWETEGATVISTPCMKLQDEFAQTRVSPNRIIPDNLGMIGLRVHDGPKVTVEPYLYPHPEEEEVELITDVIG
jgi:hypothetical protein